ncbi:MAG: hypothetical protein ACE5WD_14115 [Candidatus Aminicenantia bacterium]
MEITGSKKQEAGSKKIIENFKDLEVYKLEDLCLINILLPASSF